MKQKLLKIYCFLLVLAVSTMVMLWQFVSMKEGKPSRDYPSIVEEGILRIAITNGDTTNTAFYYELIHHLSDYSGLEIQLSLLESPEECIKALQAKQCDIVAYPRKEQTPSSSYSWSLRDESPILKDSLNRWLLKIIEEERIQPIKDIFFQ